MPPISVVVWLVFSPALAPAHEAAQMRATVWIRAGDRAVGTGWVVDVNRCLIVTARHVVADREKVEVFFQDDRAGKPITDRVHYLSTRADLLKRGRVTSAEVIAKNDNADLVILRAHKIPSNVPALRLASHIPRVGHDCYSIGHRHDAETLWCRTTGTIRQLGRLSEGYFWAGKRIGVGIDVIQIQSPIESGESGAALLDSKNEVIAVISAVSNRTPSLATAIGLGDLHKLLAQARQDQRVIEVTQTVEKRPDVAALMHGTVWVRPQATEGRFAGAFIDSEHELVLTTAAAVGKDDIVDVVLPKWEKGRLVAEASEYADLLALRFSGHCIQGVVLARDIARDLALIQLDDLMTRLQPELPNSLQAFAFAKELKAGDRVSAMSHVTGEELLWLYSDGSVRSIGRAKLNRDSGDETAAVLSSILQLPHQGTSSGGPVVNKDGKLAGILSGRDGARQELAYSTSPSELQEFLDTCKPTWKASSMAEWLIHAKHMVRHGRNKQAFRLCPDDAPDWNDSLARAYEAKLMAERGYFDSPTLIARAAKLPNRTPDANVMLADASLTIGDKTGARKFIDAALNVEPKHATALLMLATLKGNSDGLADVEAALSLNPNLARAYVLRVSLRDPKDPHFIDKGIADLSRAIEYEPYDISIRSRRAATYLANKDYKKAVGDYTRITELEPLNANWRLELGNAAFLAGDRTAARKHYVAAIRIDPKGESKVFAWIRRNGKSLIDDDSSDVERVADWYQSAIREVLPYVGGKHKELLTVFLKQAADQADVRKRMELLAQVLDDFVGSK